MGIGSASAGGQKKTDGEGEQLEPATGEGVSLWTSTSTNTYGAYAQVVASTSEAREVVGLILESTGGLNATYGQVQIATGSASSETVRGVVKTHGNPSQVPDISSGGPGRFLWPFTVAAGSRIAVRGCDNITGQPVIKCTVVYVESADVKDL